MQVLHECFKCMCYFVLLFCLCMFCDMSELVVYKCIYERGMCIYEYFNFVYPFLQCNLLHYFCMFTMFVKSPKGEKSADLVSYLCKNKDYHYH